MKSSDVRVTTLWVAFAAVVVAALMHWPRPIPSSELVPAVRPDTIAIPRVTLGAPMVGPRTPIIRAPLHSPKSIARLLAPMRAQVGDTLAVSLTKYCLTTLTRRDHVPREGIIAADPRVFALGREVDVFLGRELLGRFRVDDTGLLIKGRTLDIWVPDCADARRFGRQKGAAVLVAKDS